MPVPRSANELGSGVVTVCAGSNLVTNPARSAVMDVFPKARLVMVPELSASKKVRVAFEPIEVAKTSRKRLPAAGSYVNGVAPVNVKLGAAALPDSVNVPKSCSLVKLASALLVSPLTGWLDTPR